MKQSIVRYIAECMQKASLHEGVPPARATTGGSRAENRSNLVSTDPEAAVNRAYYAVFHALTALFALRGQSFTKHSALRTAVHKDLVKAGVWSVELGKDFDLVTSLRRVGDYGGVTDVSEQDARRAVAAARRIIAACQGQLSSFE